MKNEDFLDLLNEIDEKYIESASKRLEELHQYQDPVFGKALKPQVIRVETPEKRRFPLRGAAFAAAAAMICAVTVGVYFKLIKPPTFSPSSGVILSETSSVSEPTVSDMTSREPVSSQVSSEPEIEPNSSEPISSEPWVFEPSISEGRMKKLEDQGYNFSFETDKKDRSNSGPFLKIDRVKGITIALECSPDCEGRRFTIEFYSYISRNKTVDKCIATLTFTARSYTQSFNVLYDENELKEGDECIMFIRPEDRDYTSRAAVNGKILP